MELSYLSIARTLMILKTLGHYPLSPESSKTKRTLHWIYMIFVSFFVLLYTFQQILNLYQDRNDLDKVMETIFLFLTYTDYIFKIATLWLNIDRIEEVIKVTKGPIYNQGKIEHRNPLLNTARLSLLTACVFSGMSLLTCVLWSISPTVKRLQGKTAELPLWLPFNINSNLNFYLAVLYMWMQTSWLALGNTTIDIFIVFLFEQCKTQVAILRLDLENIVKNSDLQAKEIASSVSDALEIKLKNIIRHHSVIIETAAKIQDIFGSSIFYQFFVGGWILCTSAYRMVKVDPASVECLSMISYINCILIQVFLYCYFGNKLAYESNMLMESAYAAEWLDFPVKLRRILIIFMERIKYPIQPMAGFIVPLSNSTFVSILRSSYSFYAFLRNSDKN